MPQRSCRPAGREVSDHDRCADRAGRSIEEGEDPVAGRFHLPAAEARQRAVNDIVVKVEKLGPPAVAGRCELPGRVNDIGEDDRRQHSVETRCLSRAGQELLDEFGDLADRR